jgi:oligopeptide transport system substrate-binding protein
VVKLLVNRNDQHRQIAQSVATMWRKSLGIETELLVKTWEEYEDALRNGEYDVVRKGIVMQTMDEVANMRAMFEENLENTAVEDPALVKTDSSSSPSNGANEKLVEKSTINGPISGPVVRQPILSQAEALKQLPAIPIYFASSYSLVRPYVSGFDNNLLDAPSLKRVRLDTSWQAPKPNASSWFRVGD